MKKMIYALSTIGLACAFNANAIEVYKSDKNTVSIGGDVSVILQNVDHQGTTTIEDNTSKINFGFTHKLPDDWQVAAFFEWAINVVGKANLAIADGIIAADEDSDYLTNRQGYIQVSHDTYGSLTLGKQWGVWYDVVGPTDNEEVWGGEATGAYTYDGDGGVDGTGRADKAIVYRNQFGQISIGLQAQLKQDSFQTETNIFDDQPVAATEVNFNDSYGASIAYAFNQNLSVTAGFNHAEFEAATGSVTYFSDTDYIYGIGVAYGQWGNDGWYAAASINKNQYHELDNVGRLIPESKALSTLFYYQFDNGLRPIFSYDVVDADDSYSALYNGDDFVKKLAIVGLHYVWDESTLLFIEGRLDYSDFDGSQETASKAVDADAIALGIEYDF
ncbi:porin [Shewanella marina]|uniref:porin n=1 Tax=Shewanella marina TaxID=487319 RepID=UPI0004711D87|nr:porin [Shewanella marina]